MFDLLPPTTAHPLFEGLHLYGDPRIVAWFDEHPRSNDDDELARVRRDKIGQLVRSIRRDIRNEALIATAFELPITIGSQRRRISPDVWDILEFDVVMASATVAPLRLSDIKLQENPWASKIYPLSYALKNLVFGGVEESSPLPEPAEGPSDAIIKEVEAKVELVEEYGALVLRIGQDRMPFRGEKQQVIVKKLVEASLKKERVSGDDLLRAADSGVDSVPKAFSKYAHWETFRKYYRSEHNWCWLEFDEEAQRPA